MLDETADKPEPLIRGPNETWEMAFDIFDVIELGRKRVIDVDDNDFPVGLALIEQGHDSEDLDLFHLSGVTDLLADFADIQGIIVALGFSLDVSLTRVLPRLCATVSPSKRRECHFYNTPGGKRRSSRCIRGGESSCAQSATYLS